MNTEVDSPLCGVVAARLAGQQALGWLSLALTVIAGVRFTEAGASALWLLPLMLGLAERYMAVRVAIDARLFDQLAKARLNLTQLDEALRTLGMSRSGKEGRPLAQRLQGAMAWTRRHTAVVVAQILSIAVVWGVH